MKSRLAFKTEDWKDISYATTEVFVSTDFPFPNGIMDRVITIETSVLPTGCRKPMRQHVTFGVSEFRQMYKAVEHWLTVLENDGDVL